MSFRSTVALLRLMPLKKSRSRRLPRQLQPDLIRTGYYNEIIRFTRLSTNYWRRIESEVFSLLRFNADVKERYDVDEKKRARQLIDLAASATAQAFEPREIEAAARKYAQRTSDFQRQQLGKQVQSAFGVPLSTIEKPVREKVGSFVQENVSLIKTVPERYFDRLRKRIEQAFEDGERPEDVVGDIQDIGGMSDRDALRIANDQIGKLNAQLNQARQEQLGVDEYIWRTVNDNRVRDEHSEREGQKFSWDNPPEDGHPGEPINCRCYAEPVLKEILEEL